ncbi:hypothetical protein [Caulobacter sp.]|uniref:hypothetical protein n=1 Tax=Caulobacter sp. TaxID=78 RepID=UPI003BB1E983
MATYNIQVLNNSGFAKSYVVFMEPPVVTSSGGQPVIFPNAWATFTSILPNGYDSVTYTDTTYACWSTTPDTLAPGVVLTSGGSALVDTAQNSSAPFIAGPPTGFGAVTSGVAMSGSFSIVANGDFTADNGYVFGMAKPGQTPIPTPVATFLAQPNDTFNITPVVQFYVSDGSYTPGQVIDITAISTNIQAINFTGLPQTTATVVQAANGEFSVVYS